MKYFSTFLITSRLIHSMNFDFDFIFFVNIVSSRLRKKLNEVGTHSFIIYYFLF